MQYYYEPQVKLLLINHSHEKVRLVYVDSTELKMPKIGPRPPYYSNPRYKAYYPVI